jgi:hypothetical protein
VSVGVAVLWLAGSLLAFLALTAVVVVLGASSTARFEFERNGAREENRAEARVAEGHPAGRRRAGAPEDSGGGQGRAPQAVATRPVAATSLDGATGEGWWLVAEVAGVVAGPFADRVDAEWAALANGYAATAVYGMRRANGSLARRTSPQERAWLAEFGEQLDRLPDEWDVLLTDTDPLTTLVVEVAAALVEAGLPLHDGTPESAAGGVSLTPDVEHGGVLVRWRAHDRISVLHVRGAATDAVVQLAMNTAIADVLTQVGFVLAPIDESGCHLVTAIRP